LEREREKSKETMIMNIIEALQRFVDDETAKARLENLSRLSSSNLSFSLTRYKKKSSNVILEIIIIRYLL
jgi:hypothetical protein